MRNPWEEKKIPLSSSCTANVDRNGRSQALNDSLRWYPALAYQIKLTPSCPWVQGQGRRHAREEEGTLARPARLDHLLPHKDISKPMACCKTAKPSLHQARRRKTMSAQFVTPFHLLSLTWKWEGSSVSLLKRRACILGRQSVKTPNIWYQFEWLRDSHANHYNFASEYIESLPSIKRSTLIYVFFLSQWWNSNLAYSVIATVGNHL